MQFARLILTDLLITKTSKLRHGKYQKGTRRLHRRLKHREPNLSGRSVNCATKDLQFVLRWFSCSKEAPYFFITAITQTR